MSRNGNSTRSGRWSLFRLGTKSETIESSTSTSSTSSSSIFGRSLPSDPSSLPLFVAHAFQFLEPHLQEQGLFRISGDSEEIKALKQRIDNGESIDFNTSSSSPHVVAGIVKLYFRELPEPLLTYDLYDMFIAADSVPEQDAQVQLLRRVLKFLPVPNYTLLASLCQFLHRVASFKDTNLMPPPNLAIVFAPNLLRPRVETTDIVIGDYPMANSLMTIMIEAYPDIFETEPQPQPMVPLPGSINTNTNNINNNNNNDQEDSSQPSIPDRPKPVLDDLTKERAKRVSLAQRHQSTSKATSEHSTTEHDTQEVTPTPPTKPKNPPPGSLRSRHRVARARRAASVANLPPTKVDRIEGSDSSPPPQPPPKPTQGLPPVKGGTLGGAGDLKRRSVHSKRMVRRSMTATNLKSKHKAKDLPATPPDDTTEEKSEHENENGN